MRSPQRHKETVMFNQKLSTRVQASQSKVGVFRSGLFVQVGLVVLVLVGAVAVALAADNAAKRAAEQRAVEAYAARWTGLGQEHLLRESRRERAQAADEA